MECELVKAFEEDRYALIVGKVLRLEVEDEALKPDGSLDVEKARPLLITGSPQGDAFLHPAGPGDIRSVCGHVSGWE